MLYTRSRFPHRLRGFRVAIQDRRAETQVDDADCDYPCDLTHRSRISTIAVTLAVPLRPHEFAAGKDGAHDQGAAGPDQYIGPDLWGSRVRLNGADHQWGKDPPKEVVG